MMELILGEFGGRPRSRFRRPCAALDDRSTPMAPIT